MATISYLTRVEFDHGAIGRPVRARAMHTGFYQPRDDGERAWVTDLSSQGTYVSRDRNGAPAA